MILSEEQRQRSSQPARIRLWFYAHFMIFLLASGGFFVLNLGDPTEETWFLWPVLGWGSAVVIHAVAAYLLLRGELGRPMGDAVREEVSPPPGVDKRGE